MLFKNKRFSLWASQLHKYFFHSTSFHLIPIFLTSPHPSHFFQSFTIIFHFTSLHFISFHFTSFHLISSHPTLHDSLSFHSSPHFRFFLFFNLTPSHPPSKFWTIVHFLWPLISQSFSWTVIFSHFHASHSPSRAHKHMFILCKKRNFPLCFFAPLIFLVKHWKKFFHVWKMGKI